MCGKEHHFCELQHLDYQCPQILTIVIFFICPSVCQTEKQSSLSVLSVCLVKQQLLPVSSQTKPATGAKTGAGGCLAHNSLGSYLIRLIFCPIHKLSSNLDNVETKKTNISKYYLG